MVSSTSPADTNGVSGTDTANGTGNINQGNSKTKRADDGEGNSRTEEKVTTDDSQGLAHAVEVTPTQDGKVATTRYRGKTNERDQRRSTGNLESQTTQDVSSTPDTGTEATP